MVEVDRSIRFFFFPSGYNFFIWKNILPISFGVKFTGQPQRCVQVFGAIHAARKKEKNLTTLSVQAILCIKKKNQPILVNAPDTLLMLGDLASNLEVLKFFRCLATAASSEFWEAIWRRRVGLKIGPKGKHYKNYIMWFKKIK